MQLKILLLLITLAVSTSAFAKGKANSAETKLLKETTGFTDASTFGFSPEATGLENSIALQKAIDLGGTIIVSQPGTYKIASTLYIRDNTGLIFGNGVYLKKVDEQGRFAQVFINKGALTKTYNEHISIEGLHIIVNGVDNCSDLILGLRGEVGFSYVGSAVKIEGC